jgi:dienelactone hydrolase
VGGGQARGRDDADAAVELGGGGERLSPQEALARQRRIFVDDVVAVPARDRPARAPSGGRPSRIGLVGWSLGARVAAVTAGADPRLKAVVLMSGGAARSRPMSRRRPRSFALR